MARRKRLDVTFGAKRVKPEEELESGLPREFRERDKAPRDLSVRVGMRRPRTATEAAVLEQFGLEPGIDRPGLIPLSRNPITDRIELTMPQVGYDLLRAIAAPEVARSGAYPDLPFDPQEEAANLAGNFTGAGVASRLAVKPVEGVVLGMAGGPRTKLGIIATEYGDDVAKRLQGLLEPDAPLKTYRQAAQNLAASDLSNTPRALAVRKLEHAPYDPSEFGVLAREKPETQATRGLYEEKYGTSQIPDVSIQNLIGRPFITSMADRTAAMRRLLGVNNVIFDRPVDLLGGQGFMFDPTTGGLVWASDPGVVTNLHNMARVLADKYGVEPLYLPFRMKGTGSDFSTMTGETMMRYASGDMGKSDVGRINKALNEGLPWREKFAGIGTPEGEAQYRALPGKARVRFAEIMNQFSPEGGLSQGQTRLLIADPSQVDAPQFMLQNVGIINPDADIVRQSGHPAFSSGLPGSAVGPLEEHDINIMELLPEVAQRFKVDRPDKFAGSPVKLTPEEAAAHGASRMDPGYLLRNVPQSGFIDEKAVESIIRRRKNRE